MGNERDERLVELFGPMANAVVTAAPDGWERARLRAYASPFRGDSSVVYWLPGGTRDAERQVELSEELAALVQLAKGPGAGLEVVLEVSHDGYEAAVTPRSKRGMSAIFNGHLCFLGDFSPPEAGEPPEGPADASEAGDPDEAVRLLEETRRRLDTILDPEEADPSPPVSPELLAELEERAGLRLPADLRALYERAEHDPRLFYWSWLSVREILGPEDYLDIRWPSGSRRLVLDADPPETVRRVTGHPSWLPFAHDGSGNYLLVDMAPARNGRPGQVIAKGNDYADGPGYVADSVTSLLRRQLEWLDAGEYDHGAAEFGDLDFNADLWHEKVRGARTKRVKDASSLPGVVTPKLQHLTIRCDDPVDLSPLKNAPLLKYLEIHSSGFLNLTPLRDLPLEHLVITTTATDPTPLTGNPTLLVLNLATEQPVTLSFLRTLPALYHLNLSKTPVTDALETLADLPTLRHLYLSPTQWQEFRKRTDRHPPLATAAVIGDLSSSAATIWADAFPSHPAPTLLHHSAPFPADDPHARDAVNCGRRRGRQ